MESTSFVARGLAGKLHVTPVLFTGGIMGAVKHGKGVTGSSSSSKRPSAVLVERITCLHVGSNMQAKHSAYHTRALTAAEHMTCSRDCGFVCQK